MYTITALFTGDEHYVTAGKALWQWDVGQTLLVEGIDLAQTHEVHFCNLGDSSTQAMICSGNSVNIPNRFLRSGRDIIAYFYIYDGQDGAKTEYVVTITVIPRPIPSEQELNDNDMTTIEQIIDSINSFESYIVGRIEEFEGDVTDQIEEFESGINIVISEYQSEVNSRITQLEQEMENASIVSYDDGYVVFA